MTLTRPDDKPLLLVITSGLRQYREYLLRSIAGRYGVHPIDAAEPTWELPHLSGHTVVPDTGTRSVLEAARRIAAEQPVAGVMSWHEEHIVQAALVAEELGLPGTPPDAVRRCQNKYATRTALAEANLPQAAVLRGQRGGRTRRVRGRVRGRGGPPDDEGKLVVERAAAGPDAAWSSSGCLRWEP
jgi:hypothetical protein